MTTAQPGKTWEETAEEEADKAREEDKTEPGTSSQNSEYSDMLERYSSLAETCKQYNDVDITQYIPSIEEMLKEDCVWDVLKQVAKEVDEDNENIDKEQTAYYIENPPSTKTGYDSTNRCFIIEIEKDDDGNFLNSKDSEFIKGEITGSMMKFDIEYLQTKSFTVDDVKYNSYKEYATANKLVCKYLNVQNIGLQCAAIPHYTMHKTTDDKVNVKEMTIKYKDINQLSKYGTYHMQKYKIDRHDSTDYNNWTYTNWEDDDEIKFLCVPDEKSEGIYLKSKSYFQIADDYIQNKCKPGEGYTMVVGNDDSGEINTIKDGYKAQARLKKVFKDAKKCIVAIDKNIVLGQKSTAKNIYYNSLYFTDRNIRTMIDTWSESDNISNTGNVTFNPFGVDNYGTSLGNAWVLKKTSQGDMWINVGKYVSTGTEYSEVNPSFTNSTELNGAYNGASDTFKQWTNQSNDGLYADSLSQSGTESYQDRLKLHKQLTGIDFTGEARNCTVLLGDCMFMLPPQSIRVSSSMGYEKLPIIRGKGSMVKNNTNIEQLIEMDLYFAHEEGINGIRYKTKTPNNKDVTYYMNGLRSLIAQFKLAPFLPIENHYINDILGIEAVSLVSMQIGTVDGFPHLLKCTMLLRDFNYRVFMPDLPLPDYGNDLKTIAQMQPIFAQCFNWELFRYYYQRCLIHGSILSSKDFNSYDYADYYYSYNNTLSPADLNDSEMEIYVPDTTWLKSALSVKKIKDQSGGLTPDPEDSEEDPKEKDYNIVSTVNDNKPTFSDAEKKIINQGDEKDSTYTLSELDSLGRAGAALGCIRKKHTEDREDLKTNPTGWQNDKSYSFIDGGKLYQRCHLLGFQLTGLQDEPKNLITGTTYFNGDAGMLTYENKVAQYVKDTGKPVLYKVTPDFKGNNLLASGVYMQAMSVEDDGKALSFNVYIKNEQPYVKIDYSDGSNEEDKEQQAELDKEVFDYNDYKQPQNMKFVPYMVDENGDTYKYELDTISFSINNVFTETYLKAMDGYAPQFMGGSDTTITLTMTLTEEAYVGALKALPSLAVDLIKQYRRIMPCFPLKIKNSYLQMMGVCECLIDNITIDTKDGFPGVYEVVMSLSSVDRSNRKREMLTKINTNSNTSTSADNTISNYFNLEDSLSAAEVYPDLDLPTVDELKNLGWKFAKWANEKRVFVDPDFYMCYSYQYSARLIKTIINNVINKISYQAAYAKVEAENKNQKLTKEQQEQLNKATELNRCRLIDNNGIGLDIEPGPKYEGTNILDSDLGLTKVYDDMIAEIQKNSNQDNTQRAAEKKRQQDLEDLKTTLACLMYVTMSGIDNGWQIKPGWNAPICADYMNDEIKKLPYAGFPQENKEEGEIDNKAVEELYDIRHRALMYINRILDKPIDYYCNSLETYAVKTTNQQQCAAIAVDLMMGDSNMIALAKLLDPMNGTNKQGQEDTNPWKKNDNLNKYAEWQESTWNIPDLPTYLAGYLYALACARSGHGCYKNDKSTAWQPKQHQAAKYKSDDEKASKLGLVDEKLPYVKVETSKSSGDYPLCKTYNEWYYHGIQYGAGQITRYNKSRIKKMLQPKSKVTYFNKEYKTGAAEYYNNMYYKTKKEGRKRFCETGFIDQYYNFAGYKSDESMKYRKLMAISPIANYMALFREMLMFLKRLIMDGYFFSEVDIITGDWDKACEILDLDRIIDDDREAKKEKGDTSDAPDTLADIIVDAVHKGYNKLTGEESEDDGEKPEPSASKDLNEYLVENTGYTEEYIENLKEALPETYKKIFCARMIYPFLAAATMCSKQFEKIMRNRDYATLDTYTLNATVGTDSSTKINKFLNALYGVQMISSSNNLNSAQTTSDTQKMWNTLMAEAYTKLSSDPRCYCLHSLYDMCVSDRRGRLLRAFPSYYICFVDEGRMIGTWKLFDNFYNMSSISNLEVVKSRKIPADTCTFTMSNMFISYTDTYDNSIYAQYVNAYSMKDTFDSIFSPRGYVSKEDAIRRRKEILDTQPLTPGVRLHVRMGYGSDASLLPIVFNGKIAEVSCGDTVEVVAQGDGIELNNQLNTLGDLTAQNLEESQSWFTLFKDIRGSLARGGESPRNLLAKIATAEYGGLAKTIIRELTEGRFYYDNPFGIYHFGDKRYKDIFEDSEIVQNMYEVSNSTILNGVNDLVNDVNTTDVAPTINCNIQDKTMWEIGHLCANSGDDFFFAVRDFGMRSTMCLCKPNHYYAWKYVKDKSGAEVERRKPFQQIHYYDSYNDIIYNGIYASEQDMKTNAVGTWEGSDYIWGTSQKSVGPIYLDMNIYPEHQKSMTVETGLVSGGNGGLNIPLFQAIAEKFDLDECQGRVNKSLAEKVTTNVLRQSVKDMYQGEMCVLGDGSLKPGDRVTLIDTYEDMQGDVEVESVIHSMNIDTGFTTTFVPDLIVRTTYSTQEYGSRNVLGSLTFSIATCIVGRFAILKAASGSASKLAGLSSLLGAETLEEGAFSAFLASVEESSLSAALFSGSEVTLAGALFNPVSLTALAVGAVSIFALTANLREAYIRFCRNIQALTVFPITKFNRVMIAGMAGHRGSVYGYNYNENGLYNPKDSIQGMICEALDTETDNPLRNMVSGIFSSVLVDDNFTLAKQKWTESMGLTESDELINGSGTSAITQETMVQDLTGSISKEYSSRACSLATLKTKPRLTSFDTNDRTSKTYMKYQIGGVYDKELEDKKRNDLTYVEQDELKTNKKIKELLPIEDEPDIKLALSEGSHPVIKKFTMAHSYSNYTFNLNMEHEATIIRYLVIPKGNNKIIFDLPMLQEDALTVLKIIINNEHLKDKQIDFVNGTRVNSTNSWQSTGFAFTISCDDMSALKEALKEEKEKGTWVPSQSQYVFNYNIKDNKAQITIYAPIKD